MTESNDDAQASILQSLLHSHYYQTELAVLKQLADWVCFGIILLCLKLTPRKAVFLKYSECWTHFYKF